MPKLIGAINDVVRDDHEVEFALSTDEALIFLPKEFNLPLKKN